MSKSEKIIETGADIVASAGNGAFWALGGILMIWATVSLVSPSDNDAVSYSNKLTAAHTAQNAVERVALTSTDMRCTAQLTGTINKGQTVTVTKTSYEAGFIMERYYIEEQGGRWYYADSMTALECS